MDLHALSAIKAGLNSTDCVTIFPPTPTLRTSGCRKLSTASAAPRNTPKNRKIKRSFIAKIFCVYTIYYHSPSKPPDRLCLFAASPFSHPHSELTALV